MIRPLFLLLLAVLAACSNPLATDGMCAAVVNIHDVMFVPSGDPSAGQATVSSDVYLTITRTTGCQDTPGAEGPDDDPLAHGESNFLAMGTTLHRVEGFGADERLAFRDDDMEEWRTLVPYQPAR